MRPRNFHQTLNAVLLSLALLLLPATFSLAQTVNLTATRQTTTLPDGKTVPMWGWVCGSATAGATCTAANGQPQTTGTPGPWQPPLIVVSLPSGNATTGSFTINLANTLPVETSLVIMGQLPGGGLGSPVREASPRTHAEQTETTWTNNIAATFQPPAQGQRVRSFAPEAAPNSGSSSYTWAALKPGTYLISPGTYPSIQQPMGLYGVLVVTTEASLASSTTTFTPGAGTAYPNINYDADIPLLLSEIDPVQNNAVEKFLETSAGCSTATPGTGACTGTITPAAATAKWTASCGAAFTCYPAAVNYTPLYYMINGASFDITAAGSSAAPIPAAASTGNVLLRFVNAGSHLHLPSVNKLSMSMIAEDGNVLPDVTLAAGKAASLDVRVQSDVYLPPGKVYDVMVHPASNGTSTTAPTAYTAGTYQVFDRELSLSSDASRHDSGMQAVLTVGGGAFVPSTAAKANPDQYYLVPGKALSINDPGKGVVANDILINGVQVLTPPTGGTLTLNPDGTFLYVPNAGTTADSFSYYGNDNKTAANLQATVTLAACNSGDGCLGGAPVASNATYTSKVASLLKINAPGVLGFVTDPQGHQLTAQLVGTPPGVTLNPDGGFTVSRPGITAAGSTVFQYQAVNSQGTLSNAATVTVNFLAGSGLQVTVQDAQFPSVKVTDYKWIIQQDLTMQVNSLTQVNQGTGVPTTLGTNFHTSTNPVVGAGCTGPLSCEVGQTMFDVRPACTAPGVPAGCSATAGQHIKAACDGSGICYPDPTGAGLPQSTPAAVNLPSLDAYGRPANYYISILPGDAANAFNTGNVQAPTAACETTTNATGPTGLPSTQCGHTMGGTAITPNCTGLGTTAVACTEPAAVTVNVEPNPIPTAQVTVQVFEDDNELNGEIDAEPGAEPGLEDFNIELWDTAGGNGDLIGQMTYDMFNEPLTNALNGMHDPLTGLDACPISNAQQAAQGSTAINGSIIVCPHFESDGVTISPLEGQAVIKNLMPGRFSVIAHPGAHREAMGQEWLQTTTLDGTHFLDSFIRAGEPQYFQEYSPAGFHISVGFANPAIINARLPGVCTGQWTVEGPFVPGVIGPPAEQDTDGTPKVVPCNNTIKGQITNLRFSRAPDERLYDSAVYPEGDARNRATFAQSTCLVSLGVLDNPDIAFAKCDAAGNFIFTGIPDGEYSVTVFDQWLDQLMFEKEVIVAAGQTLDIGTYPVFSWSTAIWNNTYMDLNGNGIQDAGEPGLIQVPVRIRQRNGKFENTLLSDINGQSLFNEVFALSAWYTIESDTTRFRATGVHTVYDAGGPVDPATATHGYPAVLNSIGTAPAGYTTPQLFPVPANLQVPGAVYCGLGDCTDANLLNYPNGGGPGGSTGRIDPGTVTVEGVQSFAGENLIMDWGKQPYVPGETGGIRGHVTYSSTRPFDDPAMLFQNLWEPLAPNVTINLYQESTAADGSTSLTLIDTTQTSSWDAWAQGVNPATGLPNMNCPGQPPNDPFYAYTLYNTANYLDPTVTLPNNSQYKCYDGLHSLNQIQPAPYDGLYQFPSPVCQATAGASFVNPNNPAQTIKCATVPNPAFGGPPSTSAGAVPAVLPAGKYVVEAIPPVGYETVKEEDKNILIGDNFIAPVVQQFGALSNIFIVPDQATVANTNPSYTGPSTAANQFGFTNGIPNGNIGQPTTNMGRTTDGDFGPGGLTIQNTPCVGQLRVVPDFMSIAPQSGQVAPFAGAIRPLCDRKEVTVNDQMQGIAEFFIWTKTPAAASYTGFITDDMSSEYDPNSPDFGEKFAVPNLPVSNRDPWGLETSRTLSDQFGYFNGLIYSTWEVNPPNPAGYSPNMMINCMNDPGPILDTRTTIPNPTGSGTIPNPTLGQMITDPNFNPLFSDFCYEDPFMPMDVDYLDTPVVPVAAFAEGYNPPDCAYPDTTPQILRVDGDGPGPWVSAAGHKLTITSLGNQQVLNHAYSGPAATTSPYNERFITRHYGFGTTKGTVTIGGVTVPAASITTWSDTSIALTVPSTIPNCAMQQMATYGGSTAKCGELVITSSTGRQSINTVTVTVGGKSPTYVNGENATSNAVQQAIDAAKPGDLIIINGGFTPATTAPAGTSCATATVATANCVPSVANYNEMIIMWKPLRLQGVGSASAIINANAHPAGKLTPWRAQVDCLFGLNTTGYYLSASNPFDSTGQFTCPSTMQNAADPLTDENVTNWDANLNGYVAEVLAEPTLMGALEGAALTVVGKGCESVTVDPTEGPTCNAPLTTSTADCKYVGNFRCNPSRVDGLSFTNSSAGGGGMFIHGYQHFLEISNNHVYGNGGNFSGGIDIGQLEVTGLTTLLGLVPVPYAYNVNMNVHHNAITGNASFGDEFQTDTPAAGGGITFCTGADNYKFQYNWVCGNFSGGDGGGLSHYGLSENGTISNNWFLLNQSFNQTLPTDGGAITIQGVPNPGTCEGPPIDTGCPPQLTDGSGNVTISNNIIMANMVESGNGGGIRLQLVNGTDVQRNPNNNLLLDLVAPWWQVTISDNVIVNNVAAWAGGGISLRDAVNTIITNNTIASNDSTNTAGVEFDTVGANQGSLPPTSGGTGTCVGAQCNITNPITTSTFSPAGIVSETNTPLLVAAMGTSVRCPFALLGNTNCTGFSNPELSANIVWQNRTFHIDVNSNPTPGLQNVVSLVPQINQAVTGACPAGAQYWEIGVLGDNPTTQAAGSNPNGYKLNPLLGDMTTVAGYNTSVLLGNVTTNPGFTSQYCNGSRVPPEIVASVCTNNANARGCSSGGATGGIGVPPGIPDIDPFYPLFTLNPAATVDEGNNWINMFWGPLSLSNASKYTAAGTALTPLGNYNHSAVPLRGAPAYGVLP
jgi:hypothetical protein